MGWVGLPSDRRKEKLMGLAVWRDISLLWLIFLTLIAILPIAVIFFYCIKGMHRLRQLAKQYLPIAQEKARLVAEKTDEVSRVMIRPLVNTHARAAQASGILSAIFTRRNNG
jgi:hypothetical protein